MKMPYNKQYEVKEDPVEREKPRNKIENYTSMSGEGLPR